MRAFVFCFLMVVGVINLYSQPVFNTVSKDELFLKKGYNYLKSGNYDKALTEYKEALKYQKKVFGGNHFKVAKSHNRLGAIYYQIGRKEEALTHHNEALNIYKAVFGDKNPDVARTYYHIGKVHGSIGDTQKAINLFSKAIEIQLETLGTKHLDLAWSYSAIGISYGNISDFKQAFFYHHKAINTAIKIDDKHPVLASSYHGLGWIYFSNQDYKNAIIFQQKAIDITTKIYGDNGINSLKTYQDMGRSFSRLDKHEEAIICYKKVLSKIDILGENHPLIIRCYENLATSHQNVGNYETADSMWRMAVIKGIEQFHTNCLFLPDNKRLMYLNEINVNHKNFYSFVVLHSKESNEQFVADLLLNTKSIVLDYAISVNNIIKDINNIEFKAQYKKLNTFNKKLVNPEKLANENSEQTNWDLNKLKDEREKLAFQILQHPKLKSKLNTETIKWQDVQNYLSDDEAVISFVEFHDHPNGKCHSQNPHLYYAVVIHKNLSSPQFVRITDKKTLAKLLRVDKNERPNYLDKSSSMKAVYKALWQPLEPYLEGIKTVHISPSGILHRVPFESLQDTDDEYLAAKYEFHYYSAIRDMLKEKSQKNTYEDMLLMGHILYDLDKKSEYEQIAGTRDGIDPLKETLKEVMRIDTIGREAHLKTTLLTIDAATEDTVQTFVGKRAPSIIHFATHGVFLPPLEKRHEGLELTGSRDRLSAADNPLQRSALILAGANETWTKGRPILGSGEDGILTAFEVTVLDLQNTDLVVLSACSTGLGNVHNTEGVFGLQRAFKLAGVDYVVASLWDVDDTATKDLMVEFYTNLLERKQDPATALRNAKKYLREVKQYSDPEDWAGFILIE